MMNYSMLEEARELAGWSKQREAFSIYQALSTIEDRRGRQGKRYRLALLLTCVLLAKLAGETTLQAITEWIRFRSPWLHEVLPETRATFPCAATYSNVLRAVDPGQVNQVLMDLLTRVRAEKREAGEQRHVALDGKTLRGTQHHLTPDQKKMHHMNLYETHTEMVLKEQMVAEKDNELTHAKDFLTPLLMKGRLLSADALFTQHTMCQEVIASGGHYLLFVKNTNPPCARMCRSSLEEPPHDCLDWRTASTTNKGHGRLEHRLHWRRDVTLAEDACQVRKGSAPHALATLNSFVLALFDFFGVENAKQYMRYLDAQPLRAVQFLLTSLGKN